MKCTSYAFDLDDHGLVEICAEYAQHIYCLPEHAIIPKDSKIIGDKLKLPSGEIVKGAALLEMEDDEVSEDLNVYGCYAGITGNMLQRHHGHGYEIFGNHETTSTHYRISRV